LWEQIGKKFILLVGLGFLSRDAIFVSYFRFYEGFKPEQLLIELLLREPLEAIL